MSLRSVAFSAGRWTTASAVVVATLQVLQTAILARLLYPDDFGLMAVASAVTGVLMLAADLGISRALIHFDDIPVPVLSDLYWLNLGMAIALGLLLIAAAPLVGALFETHSMVPLLQLSALVFPLTALGQQLRALAEKALHFRILARNEMLAALVGLLVALAIAISGGGVYALVAGMLATALFSSILAWLALGKGHQLHFQFRPNRATPYLRFGAYLVGDGIAASLARQADVFVAGMFLNPATVGLYAVPRDLSLKLGLLVNPVMTRVGFPLMTKVKSEKDKLHEVYLQTLRMSASINFPAYVALALFANEIIALLYGPRWHAAGDYLRLLAAWGLVRSIGNPVGSLLHAVGRARLAFWWNLGLLAVLPLFYVMSVQTGGTRGLALCLVLTQLALLVPGWWILVRPSCGASLTEYIGTLAMPLAIALASGLCAWAVTRLIDSAFLRLALGGLTGGVVYCLLSWPFNRVWAIAMLELLHVRQVRQDQANPPDS